MADLEAELYLFLYNAETRAFLIPFCDHGRVQTV